MVRSESRTYNIFRNAFVSVVCQCITILLGFACRKALIASMGLAYVGVNSLFSSIVSMLSFVELGIGNAIVFSLYKPIADHETEKIKSFISYYKKIYNYIACAIFVIGIIVIPFLDKFVTANDGISENIYVMYILTLITTACTYLYAAPKTLLIADQNQYIEKIIYQVCHIAQVILQIVILFVWKDYYLFLVVQIIFSLSNNLLATYITNKKYPYLKTPSRKISRENKYALFTNVRAMFLYKVGSSFLNYVSNIFISYYCGLVFLGKIANYILILSTLSGVVTQLTSAFSASVGNKRAIESSSDCKNTFFQALFVTVWITGFFAVGYFLFADQFVAIIFGQDCIVDYNVVIVIGALYFVQDTHSISTTYRYALGVFRKGRYAPLVASILNIIFSVIFYKLIGVSGLFIATILARLLTLGIVDAYLIIGGRTGVLSYYYQMFKYILVISVLFLSMKFIMDMIHIHNIVLFIVCATSFAVIYNLIWYMIYRNGGHCRYVISRLVDAIPIFRH